MTEYRVVDLATQVVDPEELIITGVSTPEAAAKVALGVDLYRSGRKEDLRARVYYRVSGGALSMVRLYTQAINRPASGGS